MSMFLLAASARGLFIAMLIVMIVVSLLFGFIVFMLLKPAKKQPEAVDPNNVRNMLARRETQLTVELMSNKDDEAKRAELVNKLRRVKSAQMLVDELVEEEKAIVGATDAEEKERIKQRHHSAGEKKPARAKEKPESGKREKPSAEEKAEKPERPVKDEKSAEGKPSKPEKTGKPDKHSKPDKQAVKKKKDDMEFNPSLDD